MRSICGCARRGGRDRWRRSSQLRRCIRREEAETWEHMALTRARVVAGDAGPRADDRGGDRRDAAARERDAAHRRRSAQCARSIAREKGDERSLGPQARLGRAARHRIRRANISSLAHDRRDFRAASTPRRDRPRGWRARLDWRRRQTEILTGAHRLFADTTQTHAVWPSKGNSIRRRRARASSAASRRLPGCPISTLCPGVAKCAEGARHPTGEGSVPQDSAREPPTEGALRMSLESVRAFFA